MPALPVRRDRHARPPLSLLAAGLAAAAGAAIASAPLVFAGGPSPSASSPTLAASTEAASAAPSPHDPNTPIEHLVFLLQEDHTFDNYFSSYPGVHLGTNPCLPDWVDYAPSTQIEEAVASSGIWDRDEDQGAVGTAGSKAGADSTARPSAGSTAGPSAGSSPSASSRRRGAAAPSATTCYGRYHIPTHRTISPNHNAAAAFRAHNGGKMDGFVASQAYYGMPADLTMGYYDGSDIPLYYNLADNYVLAQRFFSSAWGGSQRNHLYTIAAQAPTPVPKDGYDIPTIFDRLEAAGVSWKFYVQGYDPTINFRTGEKSIKSAQLIWDPLCNFPRFMDDPKLFAKIVDLDEYFVDLQRGSLPSVAYLVPSGLSEHPPGDIVSGQTFAVSTVTSLMRSSAWDSSLWIVSWDDWGGFYDHMPPPQVDGDGYGFRVPALIVSPYARSGLIDNTTYDFTSIMRFIESNWSVAPLTARDATANSIATALDFGRPPAHPVFPAGTWTATPSDPEERRIVLVALYSIVLSISAALVLLLGSRAWRRRDALAARRG